MYTHVVLIWLIHFYWVLPLAWEKHWITEAVRTKISIPSTFPFPHSLQCYFENHDSIDACFPIFHTPFFAKSQEMCSGIGGFMFRQILPSISLYDWFLEGLDLYIYRLSRNRDWNTWRWRNCETLRSKFVVVLFLN